MSVRCQTSCMSSSCTPFRRQRTSEPLYSTHFTSSLLLSFLVYYANTPHTFVLGNVASSLRCEGDKLPCRNGEGCYSPGDRCDRLNDCSDGTDELNCGCAEDEFTCLDDKTCQPLIYRCDGNSDCWDASDEQECDPVSCATADEFQCESDKKCILPALHCDGTVHCDDGSDENNCTTTEYYESYGLPGCDEDTEFDCVGDGSQCIALSLQCDNTHNCNNSRDENITICSRIRERCGEDRRGCEHTCRPTEHGYECTCNAGFQLMSDHKSCEDVNECESRVCSHNCTNIAGGYMCSCFKGFSITPDNLNACTADGDEPVLLIANGSQLLMYGVRTRHQRLHVMSETSRLTSVIYDQFSNGKIFWIDSDKKSISWIPRDDLVDLKFNGRASIPQRLITTHIINPVSLAFDWVHSLLYWSDAGLSAVGEGAHADARIEVVSITSRQPISRYTLLTSPHIHDARYLLVDPRQGQGYLYWAEVGIKPDICRSGLDGSEPKCFVAPNIIEPIGLAIDYWSNTLYWMDGQSGAVEGYNLLNGQKVVVTTFPDYPQHSTAIDIFEDWLYWVDNGTAYRWNVLSKDYDSPQVESLVQDLYSASDIIISHQLKHPNNHVSYCGSDNGGCSHICLPSPHYKKYRCVCPNVDKLGESYQLDVDAKRCLHKGSSTLLTADEGAAVKGRTHGGGVASCARAVSATALLCALLLATTAITGSLDINTSS